MVAACRHHFDFNPFRPPGNSPEGDQSDSSARLNGKHDLSNFVDRRKRRDRSEYLSPHNRYFKMIDRKMKSGDNQRGCPAGC